MHVVIFWSRQAAHFSLTAQPVLESAKGFFVTMAFPSAWEISRDPEGVQRPPRYSELIKAREKNQSQRQGSATSLCDEVNMMRLCPQSVQ